MDFKKPVDSVESKEYILNQLKRLDISLETKTLIPMNLSKGTKLIGEAFKQVNLQEFFNLMNSYITEIMLSEYKIHKVEYPYGSSQDKIFIYSSFLNNLTQKILFVIPDVNSYPTILSQGSLVYEGIHIGSILNLLKVSMTKGYTVHIMNSLLMKEDYLNHCLDAYERFVEKKLEVVRDIVLLGFGYGGIAALGIYRQFYDKGE